MIVEDLTFNPQTEVAEVPKVAKKKKKNKKKRATAYQDVKEAAEGAGLSAQGGIILRSPFYHVLSQLLEERHLAIQSLTIESIANAERNAFVVRLDSAPTEFLYDSDGYVYQERHFCIDQIYKNSERYRHGKTAIHYTETYVSATTGSSIVVHGYLSKHGHYLYSQIKRYDGSTGEGAELGVDERLESCLRKNISTSVAILEFLFQERRQRYIVAMEVVKDREQELAQAAEQVHSALKSTEAYAAYSASAQAFIAAVERSNQYSEVASSKHLFVAKTLENFEAWFKRYQAASNVQSSSAGVSSPVPLAAVEEEPSSAMEELMESLEALYQEIFNALEQDARDFGNTLALNADYSEKELGKLQKRHAISENMTQTLFLVDRVPKEVFSGVHGKKRAQLIKSCYNKTTKHAEHCVGLLKTETLQGNIEAVSQLFPLVENKINAEFYEKLLSTLIFCESEDLREKLIAVCDFFHENSEDYANAVLKMSKEDSFAVSDQRWRVLLEIATRETLDHNVSALFKLYCDDNLSVFNMLLKQGVDPNGWGIKDKESWGKSFTIISGITIAGQPGYLQYLQSLLYHGANFQMIHPVEHIQVDLRKNIQLVSRSRQAERAVKSKARNRSKPLQFQKMVENTVKHAMCLVGYRKGMDGFKLLAPYLSVEDIANCLSMMAGDGAFTCYTFIVERPFIAFAVDEKSAGPIFRAHRLCVDGIPFLGFLFYSNKPLSFKPVGFGDNFSIVEHVEKLNFLRDTMVEKLKKNNAGLILEDQLKQFERNYEKLFACGENELFQHKHKEANNTFRGCEFLLMAQCKLLNHKDQLTLLKKHIPRLETHMQEAVKFYEDLKIRESILSVYTRIMNYLNSISARMQTSQPEALAPASFTPQYAAGVPRPVTVTAEPEAKETQAEVAAKAGLGLAFSKVI